VQSSRLETCETWAGALAWLAYDVLRFRRDVIDDNLRHAFPDWTEFERRDVARRMWRHLVLLGCEVALAPRKIHDTNWRDFVSMRGSRALIQLMLSKRPKVIVSGHFGNFEIAGYVMGIFGCRTYAVARPLDNPFLHRYVERFRGSTGQFLLPKDGSAPQIQAVLAAGGALGLLADQHAGKRGCWVQFFGRPASCHKAVAVFTLSYDAPMLICSARRSKRALQFDMGLDDAFDPRDGDPRLQGVVPLTQWYSEVLEREIRQAPEQYWWVHRRWRKQPPPRRRDQATRPKKAA
jgi:KDO2-lipid IV(A) lauroyltransferase